MAERDVAARAVAEARRWIGTPYHHQASSIGAGCDCLGLVRGVYRALAGVEPETPPPYTPGWAASGGRDLLLDAACRHLVARQPAHAAEAGDVLVFRYRAGMLARHLAIAVSDAAMIHAYEGSGVAETALTPWWRRRIAARFAFPEPTGS